MTLYKLATFLLASKAYEANICDHKIQLLVSAWSYQLLTMFESNKFVDVVVILVWRENLWLIKMFPLLKLENNKDKGTWKYSPNAVDAKEGAYLQENQIKVSSRLQPPVYATCTERLNPLWTSQIFSEIVYKLPTCYQSISHLFVTRINISNQIVILFTFAFMLQTAKRKITFNTQIKVTNRIVFQTFQTSFKFITFKYLHRRSIEEREAFEQLQICS